MSDVPIAVADVRPVRAWVRPYPRYEFRDRARCAEGVESCRITGGLPVRLRHLLRRLSAKVGGLPVFAISLRLQPRPLGIRLRKFSLLTHLLLRGPPGVLCLGLRILGELLAADRPLRSDGAADRQSFGGCGITCRALHPSHEEGAIATGFTQGMADVRVLRCRGIISREGVYDPPYGRGVLQIWHQPEVGAAVEPNPRRYGEYRQQGEEANPVFVENPSCQRALMSIINPCAHAPPPRL